MKAVFASWRDLPHAPFRALVYMALTSLDADDEERGKKARQFYGGRESLALAMGRMVPPENKADAKVMRERHAAFAAVDRAVKELTKAKAIKVLEPAGHYRPATYQLNLSIGSTTVSVDLEHHGERGAKDHAERASSTTVSVTKHHGERGLQEEQEPGGLREGETGRGGLSPNPGAHARTGSLDDLPPAALAHTRSRRHPSRRRRRADRHVFLDDGLGTCTRPGCGLPRQNDVHLEAG